MNRTFKLLAYFFGLLVFTIFCFLGYHFFHTKIYNTSAFWDYDAIKLTTLLLTILISIVIFILVNERTQKETKRKEIILDIINKLECSIRTIYSLAITLNNNTDKAKNSNAILSDFENIDYNIIILMQNEKVYKLLNKDLSLLNQLLFDFKILVTDDPFMTKNNYSDNRLEDIKNQYHRIFNSVQKNKFKLFD